MCNSTQPCSCLCVMRRNYRAIIEDFSAHKEGSQPLHFDAPFALNFVGQYKMLTWRYMASYWRTTEYNAVRFLMAVFIAIFFGWV